MWAKLKFHDAEQQPFDQSFLDKNTCRGGNLIGPRSTVVFHSSLLLILPPWDQTMVNMKKNCNYTKAHETPRNALVANEEIITSPKITHHDHITSRKTHLPGSYQGVLNRDKGCWIHHSSFGFKTTPFGRCWYKSVFLVYLSIIRWSYLLEQ